MDSLTRGRAEQFWADDLGCGVSLFHEAGLHFVPHPTDTKLIVFCTGSSVIAAAPLRLHDQLAQVSSPHLLLEPAALQPLLPAEARYIGPAFVGYVASMASSASELARFIDTQGPAFRVLREGVSSEEWQHANLDAAATPLFAMLSGGSAVSAAGAEHLPGQIAHIGVLTHPSHRGNGLGRRVVAAVAASALSAGLLPQYRTLLSNGAALAVGKALGFELFATTMVVRWGR